MNYENRLVEIRSFLAQWGPIWNEEPLNLYPDRNDVYRKEWLDELKCLNERELVDLDSHSREIQFKSDSLNELYLRIQKLQEVPKATVPVSREYEYAANDFMNQKKIHEVFKIVPVIDRFTKEQKISNIIDLASGQGHLSRILAVYHGHQCLCLDYDEVLQRKGKKILEKYINKNPECSLVFKKQDLLEKPIFPTETLSNSFMSLGLHTCGPLANSQFKLSIEKSAKGIFNFGCCYNRLNENEVNISRIAKETPLPLSTYALNLATRGHTVITPEEFELKKKVKSYRIGIHLLLFKKLGFKKFIALGSESPKTYKQMSFSDYVIKKLNDVRIPHEMSAGEIEEFYQSEGITREVHDLFLMHIVRWNFGRVVELYLLLDRAIFLKDHGYEVNLATYFNEEVSPRNIGILASKL